MNITPTCKINSLSINVGSKVSNQPIALTSGFEYRTSEKFCYTYFWLFLL